MCSKRPIYIQKETCIYTQSDVYRYIYTNLFLHIHRSLYIQKETCIYVQSEVYKYVYKYVIVVGHAGARRRGWFMSKESYLHTERDLHEY